MTFGEKMQRLRNQAGLSQDQMAELLDVSRQAVSKWERNEAMPEAEKIIRISRQFRVSTDYLLLEEREEPEKMRQSRRRGLSCWFREYGWLLGIPAALYGLWQLLELLAGNADYLAVLEERYSFFQAWYILLSMFAPRLAPAVGWLAAGIAAAVGGGCRAGRLRWYHMGAALLAGGGAMVLFFFLAGAALLAWLPELGREDLRLFLLPVIWGLALVLAGLAVYLPGRRRDRRQGPENE